MKYILFLTLLSFLSSSIFAQNQQSKSDTLSNSPSRIEPFNYSIFPTNDESIFIKLDSRNGKMWQIQLFMDKSSCCETVLNSSPLVSIEHEQKGRFTIQRSNQLNYFLLLDQIDGKIYKVQWSNKEKQRYVILIN
jgi:hypothetical protein